MARATVNASVTLKSGDVFRVIENKTGKWLGTHLIQAKEVNKGNRYYVIGIGYSVDEAVAEMHRRAEIANVKGFC
jgi:hypothetical protein